MSWPSEFGGIARLNATTGEPLGLGVFPVSTPVTDFVVYSAFLDPPDPIPTEPDPEPDPP